MSFVIESKLINKINKITHDKIIRHEIYTEWFSSIVYKVYSISNIYIIKKIKDNIPGYELPWDIFAAYNISHEMFNTTYKSNKIRSYGVIQHDSQYFHVIDCGLWSIKEPHLYTIDNIRQIANLIGCIHTISYQWSYNIHNIYRRHLRNFISNNWSLFALYEQNINFTDNSLIVAKYDCYIILPKIFADIDDK